MKTPAERAAHARWAARRRRLQGYGEWQPFVDAEPIRAHLRSIQETGLPLRVATERMGLSPSAVHYVLWGDGNHGPGKQVRRETAEAVLGYWPTLDHFPDSARIDPTGTVRRVQALEVLGFGRLMIGSRVGMPRASFSRALRGQRVTAQVARAVQAVYDLWWNQRPEDHGVRQWIADRTRRTAAAQGYVGPLAWDDDTIDDPKAVPQTDAFEPPPTIGENVASRFLMGESVVLSRDARLEALRHLMEWTNGTVEEIAARLEMSPDAAEQAWNRMKRRAKKDGGKVPWRRVYVPRRDWARDEMESAA